MPPIKSINAIKEKWGRVTPGRQTDYTLGIQNPRRPWMQSTIDATPQYEAGVIEAIADGRFQGGVQRVGDLGWRTKTLEKGPVRWAHGVQLAEDDYGRGFAPYRDLIESIVLPPRGPRGSPANLERVRIIANALHALRLELARGG